MDSYDEDITENKFYQTLQNKFKHLYDRAAEARWMICVPRSGVFSRYSLTVTDFENHILRPSTLGKENIFVSASGKTVHFTSDHIQTSSGYKEARKVKVLFEETYFNSRDESFKVLCMDRLLEGGTDAVEDPITTNLENYEDCAEYLWGNKHSKACEKQVNDLLHNYHPVQHSTSLRHIIDETNTIFARAMRIALRDPVLRKTVKQDKAYLDLLKVAMETYVMYGVYKKVFKVLSSLLANADAALNKTTRNLSELQVKHLGIRSEFTMNVPRARRELANLNQCKTPLEKLHCLRRTVMGLSQPNMKTKSSQSESSAVLSSDDLLPILVFLVVKSEVPNWLTNLAYLHNFRFSSIHNDEFGFYLASVEAAIEHVRSGDMDGLPIGLASTKSLSIFSMSPSNMGSIWPRADTYDGTDTPSIELLFEEIRQGRLESVEKLLSIGSSDYGHIMEEMCHPLCACDRCEKLLTNKRNDPKAVTAFSRDDRGCTALHIASSYGHAQVMETLIKKGGIVSATDYHGSTPLHLACQKGQQAATLLLLHHGADINADDNDGNTPLHLCCANGHEECVKAILYSEQGLNNVEVNFPNCRGNTPLHDAARWGYENIVLILLEHGASVEARNRRKETPLMRSLNVNVSQLLQRAADMVRDGQDYVLIMSSSPDDHQSIGNESKSLSTPLRRRQGGIKISPQQRAREVEKLLRAAADGDIQMIRHHLGWESDSDDSDIDDITPNFQLCHPLCQCHKCSSLQKRTSYGVGDITVNTSNVDGFTPLHVSALHGHEALVALLLRRGANPNNRNTTYQQVTPLHIACKENRPKIVQLLLDHGAKCNSKDTRGNSPLHYCSMAGHLKCSTILIEHGANVKQANVRGNVPLHEASRNNYVELVKLLSSNSPSTVLCRNKAQLTPIQLSQNSKVSTILKKASESYQEDQVMSQVAIRPTTLVPGSPVKKVSMSQLFKAFDEADLRQHEALKHSLETFNKRKQLKRTKSVDRSAPMLDVELKHQLSIKHFDRRRLRHIELDESTLNWVTEEETSQISSGDGSSKDTDEKRTINVNGDHSSIESSHSNQQSNLERRFSETERDSTQVQETAPSDANNLSDGVSKKFQVNTCLEKNQTIMHVSDSLCSLDNRKILDDDAFERSNEFYVVQCPIDDKLTEERNIEEDNLECDAKDLKESPSAETTMQDGGKADEGKEEEKRDEEEKEPHPQEMVDLSGSIHSESSTFTRTHRRDHSNVSVEDMVTLTLDMRDNYFQIESDEDVVEEKRNWDKDRHTSVSNEFIHTNSDTQRLLDSPLTDSDVDNLVMD